MVARWYLEDRTVREEVVTVTSLRYLGEPDSMTTPGRKGSQAWQDLTARVLPRVRVLKGEKMTDCGEKLQLTFEQHRG